MEIIDLLIIYLSVGAPFAAYSYFQIRTDASRNNSSLKTVFTFLFWFPAAYRLIKERLVSQTVFFNKFRENHTRASTENNVASIQKQLERLYPANAECGSIYEFRETLERFSGLTLAAANQSFGDGDASLEFFETAQNKNAAIAVKCFNRRNRQRLLFHQSSARQDFLRLAAAALAVANEREFGELLLEYADSLRDDAARERIARMLSENFPARRYLHEKSLEKDLWTPHKRALPNVNSISPLLKITTPTARLRKKG